MRVGDSWVGLVVLVLMGNKHTSKVKMHRNIVYSSSGNCWVLKNNPIFFGKVIAKCALMATENIQHLFE